MTLHPAIFIIDCFSWSVIFEFFSGSDAGGRISKDIDAKFLARTKDLGSLGRKYTAPIDLVQCKSVCAILSSRLFVVRLAVTG
jgi:hypothetical protein